MHNLSIVIFAFNGLIETNYFLTLIFFNSCLSIYFIVKSKIIKLQFRRSIVVRTIAILDYRYVINRLLDISITNSMLFIVSNQQDYYLFLLIQILNFLKQIPKTLAFNLFQFSAPTFFKLVEVRESSKNKLLIFLFVSFTVGLFINEFNIITITILSVLLLEVI